MNHDHPFIQKMLLKILIWNNYNIYYSARRLNISRRSILNALQDRPIDALDQQKIIGYYLAYTQSKNNNVID